MKLSKSHPPIMFGVETLAIVACLFCVRADWPSRRDRSGQRDIVLACLGAGVSSGPMARASHLVRTLDRCCDGEHVGFPRFEHVQ